jgi:hypothetical protein
MQSWLALIESLLGVRHTLCVYPSSQSPKEVLTVINQGPGLACEPRQSGSRGSLLTPVLVRLHCCKGHLRVLVRLPASAKQAQMLGSVGSLPCLAILHALVHSPSRNQWFQAVQEEVWWRNAKEFTCLCGFVRDTRRL